MYAEDLINKVAIRIASTESGDYSYSELTKFGRIPGSATPILILGACPTSIKYQFVGKNASPERYGTEIRTLDRSFCDDNWVCFEAYKLMN